MYLAQTQPKQGLPVSSPLRLALHRVTQPRGPELRHIECQLRHEQAEEELLGDFPRRVAEVAHLGVHLQELHEIRVALPLQLSALNCLALSHVLAYLRSINSLLIDYPADGTEARGYAIGTRPLSQIAARV